MTLMVEINPFCRLNQGHNVSSQYRSGWILGVPELIKRVGDLDTVCRLLAAARLAPPNSCCQDKFSILAVMSRADTSGVNAILSIASRASM